MLSGTAPIIASSGQTHRHWLNRRGNRQLNWALHYVALVQSRTSPEAKAYLVRQREAGKSPTAFEALSSRLFLERLEERKAVHTSSSKVYKQSRRSGHHPTITGRRATSFVAHLSRGRRLHVTQGKDDRRP